MGVVPKRIAWVLALVAVGLAAVLSLPLIIPTAADAEISNSIRNVFADVAKSTLADRPAEIFGEPRVRKTVLIVRANLTAEEKQSLVELGQLIGQTNGNRKVIITFQ